MMLAGFETPTAGEILLDGKPIKNVPPHKRNIGMVFQNYALFPHMTVAENLAFPLQRAQYRPGRDRRRGSPARWHGPAGGARRSGGPASCPAGSSSAWRSPARWCSIRSWC